MKFVDLFAGIGGFHMALSKLGHECVWACEIDPELNNCYEKNFGIKPAHDITEVDIASVPDFDILTAGFPCQPFSSLGARKGFDDPNRGRLIDYIIDFLNIKRPKYFLLENVTGIKSHDEGKTWLQIIKLLNSTGYIFDDGRFTPTDFGIPQSRNRIFIVGMRDNLFYMPSPGVFHKPLTPLSEYLDDDIEDEDNIAKVKQRRVYRHMANVFR